MEILKIIGMGILISVTVIVVKQTKPEFANLVLLVGGIIMLLYILDYFADIFNVFYMVVEKTGIDAKLFSLVLKIIGVGYLVEFAAGVCVDGGNQSIADKIVLGGKVIILVMAIPIITSLLNLIVGLIP